MTETDMTEGKLGRRRGAGMTETGMTKTGMTKTGMTETPDHVYKEHFFNTLLI